MATTKKMENNDHWQGYGELKLLVCCWWDVKLCGHLGNSMAAPEPGKQLPRDPATVLEVFKALHVWSQQQHLQQLRGGNNPKHPPADDWILKRQYVQTEKYFQP